MPETNKSKLKRFIFFSFLAVIVAMVALPIGSAASQMISGHGTSHIFRAASAPVQGWGETGTGYNSLSIAVATMNNTTSAIVGNSYEVLNGNNSTMHFFSNDYLLSNVSLSQLNDHSANRFIFEIAAASSGNVTIGYGHAIGNTSFVFHPLESVAFSGNATNLTAVNFALTPALESENGTLMYEVQFSNATSVSTYTVSGYAIGTQSAQPWYAVGESAGYLLGGSLLFISGIFALPHMDINVSKHVEVVRKVTRKTGPKKRKTPTKKGGRR